MFDQLTAEEAAALQEKLHNAQDKFRNLANYWAERAASTLVTNLKVARWLKYDTYREMMREMSQLSTDLMNRAS